MSVTRAKYGVMCQSDDGDVLHNFRELNRLYRLTNGVGGGEGGGRKTG